MVEEYHDDLNWDGTWEDRSSMPVTVWGFLFDDRNPNPPRSLLTNQTLDGSVPLPPEGAWAAKWGAAMVARGTPETLRTRLRDYGLYLIQMQTFDVVLPLESPLMLARSGHMVSQVHPDFETFIKDWEWVVGQLLRLPGRKE